MNKNSSQLAFLTLKKLAQKSVDDSLIKLKKATDNHQHAKSQLNILNNYYCEYQQKLSEALSEGIKGYELNNFNAFIASIEQGIAKQKKHLLTLDMKQKQITNQFNQSQKNLNTYKTLLNKQHYRYLQQQNRLQQKLTDEFAQQQLARRISNEY
ncbi:flagellar export protein FliJ [Gilliamella sp. Choc4-2]|jgi:flagellar protein FliJ|uniref:flagellar export protein FliJ n=1 Tax=unclassified Gilliamella TaxID=2685620 RepID=UPI00080DCB5C|nr:flagellar export protein FliJ [Gilliamella apicola]OCG31029.1 flagellar export protein FliJ [Gilliamella apicola]OCG46597.1 flagellar export protein FliJ [Gilliamella apicola]OCG55880.1 flagellar export protein FliJ [Gilliamella apicola]